MALRQGQTRKWRRWRLVALGFGGFGVFVLYVQIAFAPPPPLLPVIQRVSLATRLSNGRSFSDTFSLSANGRFVAFESEASNLVLGDTNGVSDIFVYDRRSGAVERVSVASDGTQANGLSKDAAISADGNIVAFASEATNLVAGDTNGIMDVFVHDRRTRVTTRVSVASDGTQANGASFAPVLSANGRFVAFESAADNLVPADTNGVRDVFVHDRDTDGDGIFDEAGAVKTVRVSVASDGTQGNGPSGDPAISADGSIVAFHSFATNLVAGDTNEGADVFVHDRSTGKTTRVSVASDGSQATYLLPPLDGSFDPSISADGNLVAFASDALDLVSDDANTARDIFMHNRATGVTSRVSIASDGAEANGSSFDPSISRDGNMVAFDSEATNLVVGDTNLSDDIFVRDLVLGTTTRVSVASDGTQANADSREPSLNQDGSVVTFWSEATNLVDGDFNGVPDVFVRGSLTDIVSLPSEEVFQANKDSFGPSINSDGSFVAFWSEAANLIPDDTNEVPDVFLHNRLARATKRVSVASDGTQGNLDSAFPSIGSPVAFASFASNLVAGDTNGAMDIFVHDRATRTTTRVSVPNKADQATLGTQANGDSMQPSIGGLNREFVAFQSAATNLVLGDTNGKIDIFVHNRFTGETRRVSVASDGTQANGHSFAPAMDPAGLFVLFESEASNLVPGDKNGKVDIFMHELETGKTTRVSIPNGADQATLGAEANGDSIQAAICDGGEVIAFTSFATNLVPGDTNGVADIFIHRPFTTPPETKRVSVASDGTQGNANSTRPSVDAEPQFVAFESDATNLVSGDTNGLEDIFIHELATGKTVRVSVSADGAQANGNSLQPVLSGDGKFIAFASFASNLTPGDTNGVADVFVASNPFFVSGKQAASTALLAVSPRLLNFGGVKVGQGRSKAITVLNAGTGSCEVKVVCRPEGIFHVIGPKRFMLLPGARRKVVLYARPNRAGKFVGGVKVKDAKGGTSLRVKLVVRGVRR